MRRSRLVPWLLGAGIAVTLVLHVALGGGRTTRSLRILPDMEASVPYDAQGANPVFPDGKTLRLPAPGTAARGFRAFRYTATPEDAVRAGEELENPYGSEDTEALARGAFVYSTFCAVCHGASGDGRTPVTRRGMPPPPSLLAEHAASMKDGQMYHLVTLGQGNMTSYASQVDREDRWRAILHVRELQRAAARGGAR